MLSIAGKHVEIKPALTSQAISRNSALRRAENVLKQHEQHKNKNIKIHFMGDRGITVDDTFAFVQGKTDDIGEFTAEFDDLVLPA